MSLSSSTVGGRTKYKIVLLGDQQVGKTSIIERFINNRFEESYNVLAATSRPPSASTSLSKTSSTATDPTAYNSGIQQGSNAFALSYPAILRTPISVCSSMISPILLLSITCPNGFNFTNNIRNMQLFQWL